MPRRKISECRSKLLINEVIGLSYVGWSMTANESVEHINNHESYVVKVDQAVKGRFKKGLVLLDVKQGKLRESIDQLATKGYSHFLIEPYLIHNSDDERYISITRDRSGLHLSYSRTGGVDIEAHPDSIRIVNLDETTDWSELASATAIAAGKLQALLKLFIDNYFVLLEINPYISHDGLLLILDAAVEVDDAGIYFAQGWDETDMRSQGVSTVYENAVHALDAKSPASFNLSVLNPDGSIFLLLSGGGASIVVADEVFNRGLGDKLANYGEYSGNPTSHEAYLYTAEVLKFLAASSADKKVLFIGGAVANFTDIASTFSGIIKAIAENADQLRNQGVKVFVRRGGPRQEIGLAKMHAALEEFGLYGGVYDPSTSITDALNSALKEVM